MAGKVDLFAAVRFYVDKIVTDATIGGNFYIFHRFLELKKQLIPII